MGRGLSFRDAGDCVQVSHDYTGRSDGVQVQSSTTKLVVKDTSGRLLIDIPQLYSTVDAARTETAVKDGTLHVTLHKFTPDEKWPTVQHQEVEEIAQPSTSGSPQSEPQNDSQGAMAAREQVKRLFEAALHGRIADIEKIAPAVSPSGLSSVKDGNGRNALHFAAQGGQLEAAQYLLSKEGININSQDDSGETPLGLAAGGGQVAVAKYLIEEGADLHLALKMSPQPIHRAAATGNTEVVALLLKKGADVEAPSESGTPLLWAAGSGHTEVVDRLLAAGATPDAQAPDGVTSTLMAAAAGNSKIVDQLAKYGANPNLPATGGVTALHAAAELGDTATVQALLKAGSDPNAEDTESSSKPIHAAAFSGHAPVVEMLLPLTTPTEGQRWTVEALMAETSSAGTLESPERARSQASPMKAFQTMQAEDLNPELAAKCKRDGDIAFVGKEFDKAEEHYTESLRHDPNNHLVWANRSAARFRQGKSALALSDAQTSRLINPKYLKAWYREGEAARALGKFEDAAQAFYEAYALLPSSTMIAQDFQDAVAKAREDYARKKAQSG